ncbi:MAG: Crp/Fnr family transcriptional regulator [Dehalococcoidia bacterium]
MTNTDVLGYGAEQAARALQQVQIFADVEATEIVWIARRAHRRRVPRGSTVLQQEDRGTTAFVIISGSADVLLESEDGRQFIVARLGPGDHFGEMSLLDGEPRSATVVATSDAELLVLTREAFLEELEQHPSLMRQMLVTLSRRIRVTDAQVASLAFGDTAARLARLLVQNARREHDVLVVHAVQEQLAAMAGTTRQTVGRIFGEWRRAGYIRTGRSSTVILRPDALEQFIR